MLNAYALRIQAYNSKYIKLRDAILHHTILMDSRVNLGKNVAPSQCPGYVLCMDIV